jgi:hypothetical protein
MIFEVKQDCRQKACLVAGGHIVDPMGVNSRSTVVKGISVRLLDLMTHRENLPILCGDIGNAFITANCVEKIYAYAGPEFGDREGSLLIFKKFGHILLIFFVRSDSLQPGTIGMFGSEHARKRTAMIISAPTWMTLKS